MKTFIASTFLATGLFALAGSARAECGDVSIAEMNWASAGVAAQVDKIILEKGYGCTVTLVTGDTMPTFTSMNEKAQPDMAPEMWIDSFRTVLDQAVAEGRLIRAAPLLSEGGVQGWWIPKFLADAHPDIKTVEDALKHPELFPAPEDPSKGAVHNCPSGWSCQVSTANLFKATGAENAGFQLIDPGSAAGLDGSIANAFEKKAGWLGYYWAPTAILGKYDMTKLGFGVEYNKSEWDACTAVADCAAPKVNSYPTADVYTVVTKEFADKAGVAMNYVKTREWDNQTVSKVLAWMDENQATNEDAAKYFLETFPDLWTAWVPAEIAAKVKGAP